MEILHLDASSIHSAFLTACDSLVSKKEELNSINLFPVADGDTGDNMSATALSVIHHSTSQPTLNETFQSMANSALIGARGNSGMIFSQFFNGLTETPITDEKIDTTTFANLISKANQSVRSAILHPVEGTIITVIEAWSVSINKMAKELKCFKQLINQTLSEVNQALQSTSTILPVLKNAHVVDAGALGFYHFIRGFADYLANPGLFKKAKAVECLDKHHELPANGEPPEQRYCTEIMLSGEGINREQIAIHLEQFGDSVVSSGNAQLCRFHVHCKQPAEVFSSLFHEGTITQSKAEDMLRQYQMIHQRKYPIALVTDSSADIPKDILEENQIHIIQLNMHLDGHNLLDRVCVDYDTFYDKLASLKTYPKTSFPSPAIIEAQLGHIAHHYEQVLVLPISKNLSGTHDAIVTSSSRFDNVHVINSRQTSGGLGLLVTHAAKLIASGCSIEEIKKEIMHKIDKISLLVYVDNFESMIRSGRVSKISGKIAQFAHLKPIIRITEQGNAELFGKAFSETKALGKLVSYIQEHKLGQEVESYGIVHAACYDKALQFAKLTYEAFAQEPSFIEPVSTALGLHAGKGAIALAVMTQ